MACQEHSLCRPGWFCPASAILVTIVLLMRASATAASPPMQVYEQLKSLSTSGETIHVENLTLKRDRLEFTLSGDFQASTPVEGQVRGVAFHGQGRLRTTGWSSFERDNIHRFLETDAVDVTFTRALMLFSDDTYDQLKAAGKQAFASAPATPLVAPLEEKLVRETGMNLSAWLALAISSPDHPGLFFGEFEGGSKGRFCALIDHQGWVTANVFGLNAGEKGMLFQYRGVLGGNDVWTAFYDEADFARRSVSYSDKFNLIKVPDYRMDVDLRDPGSWLRLDVEMDLVSLRDNVQLVPLNLNEGLDEYDNERLKKGVRVKAASLAGGAPIQFIQDRWETGMWIVLPKPLQHGEKITVKLQLEGHDTLWDWEREFHYPRSTTSWFPRHGYLERSHFDVTFRHKPRTRVISVGERVRENESEDGSQYLVTEWRATFPVAFSSFAVGPFERHDGEVKVADHPVKIEYYSVPSSFAAVKEDFMVAEVGNSVTFYTQLFGDYPYSRLGAAFFPGNFGQGFPTMLLLPASGTADVYNFQFISHEGAHQWWGNKVGWRSYRDQWLSEGFAEYSSLLYAGRRESPKRAMELMKTWRSHLEYPPATDTGIGRGRLADVGPVIMGYRLSSRRTRGAYTTLIYSKGGLVLRMLHFLFSNPTDANDDAFFAMMRDFIRLHEGSWATTESFFEVAGQHFANTPIARKYGLKDLNWFMQQWVYQTAIPRYRLDYHYEQGAKGVELVGMIYQEGVPEGWFMPVPLKVYFGNNQIARGTIAALGPSTPVRVPLPAQPAKIELDPERWILAWETKEHATK